MQCSLATNISKLRPQPEPTLATTNATLISAGSYEDFKETSAMLCEREVEAKEQGGKCGIFGLILMREWGDQRLTKVQGQSRAQNVFETHVPSKIQTHILFV